MKIGSTGVFVCCERLGKQDDCIGSLYACICMNDNVPGVKVKQKHMCWSDYVFNNACYSFSKN